MVRKISLDPQSETAQNHLFGISCHLKDYRLSYLLNRQLALEFTKYDDFRDFSVYFCRDEDRFMSYCLLANRASESVLFPELRQTDFILLAEGPLKKAGKEQLLENIRAIPNVLTAFEIRFSTIRNCELILADLEMHFMKIRKETKQQYSPVKK